MLVAAGIEVDDMDFVLAAAEYLGESGVDGADGEQGLGVC